MPQFENTDGAWLAMAAVAGIGVVAGAIKKGSSNVKIVELDDYELDEEWQPGHYSPSRTLTFKDETGEHTVFLSAGRQDSISVFQHAAPRMSIRRPSSATITYVLTQNDILDYVGIEAFEGDEKMGDKFLQYDWEIEETLGKRGLGLQDKTIVQRLIPHLPY